MAGLDRPAAQQNTAFPFRNTAGDDLGVLIVDHSAAVTDKPRQVIALWHLERQLLSAMIAEFHDWPMAYDPT